MSVRAAGAAVVAAARDAALAGVVAGLVDLALVLSRARFDAGALPGTGAVVVGLSVLALTVIGTPAVLLLRLLGRHPLGRPVVTRLREPGAARVEALTAIAIAVVAIGLVWLFGYRLVATFHTKYRGASGAGLLASTEILVVAIVATIAATAAAPAVARGAGRRPSLRRATTGRLGLAIAIGLAVVLAIAVDTLLGAAAPAFDAPPAYVKAIAVLVLIAAAAAAPGARLRGAVGIGTAVACAALALGSLVAVGRADHARGAVVARGSLSQLTLRTLYGLTDGDGDGFSDAFGGGDCDDGDRRVHPGASEIADNGKDDNCAGGDASASTLGRRAFAQPSATPSAPRRHVLLVTIDTVRADRTSAHGYARATTPTLAALAARGAQFLRAESPAPLTRWAIPALLFGRYASTLPYRDGRGGKALADHELPTLASTLADAGYETRAIVSNAGLFGKPVVAGFAKTVTVADEARVLQMTDNADAVTDAALAWLGAQRGDEPWFLWVHYIDPHPPYEPPDAAPRFGDDDAYDRELAWVDLQLGRLLDGLRAAHGEDVIVAVTSDHGEAFGDHGTRYHAKSLYEDQTHVPLVIAMPGAAPQRLDAPVSLVDVAPTLLDLVGVTAPAGMNGWSLAAAVRGDGPVPPHDVIAELFRGPSAPRNLLALHRGDHVVIRDLDTSTLELYDVRNDPAQLQNRAEDPLARELADALDAAADRELGALPEEQR